MPEAAATVSQIVIIHEADHPKDGVQRCRRCRGVLRHLGLGARWSYLPGALLREVRVPERTTLPERPSSLQRDENRVGYQQLPFMAVSLRPTCTPWQQQRRK